MDYFLAVIAFTFVAGITPGPNNIMLLVSGLNHGVVRSLPHYFGVCTGFPIMVAVIGFGLGILFQIYPLIHTIIKMCGISYLVFLAWKIANAGNPNARKKLSAPLTFLQAVAFQWVNPKAWVIAIGALATFTLPTQVTQSILFIIAAYIVMGLLTMGIWLVVGTSLLSVLNTAKRVKYFNWAMAGLLLLSIIPMLSPSLSV